MSFRCIKYQITFIDQNSYWAKWMDTLGTTFRVIISGELQHNEAALENYLKEHTGNILRLWTYFDESCFDLFIDEPLGPEIVKALPNENEYMPLYMDITDDAERRDYQILQVLETYNDCHGTQFQWEDHIKILLEMKRAGQIK